MISSWPKAAANLWEGEIPGTIFTAYQVREFLFQHRDRIGVPISLTSQKFLNKLLEIGFLSRAEIIPTKSPGDRPPYKPFIRYVRAGVNAYEMALALRPGSYLSHATAARLHGLVQLEPEVIYVNKEQSPKPAVSSALSQEAIDRAFSNAPRVSQYIFEFADNRIVLLNGKNTQNYEVKESKYEGGSPVMLSSLERTLVDIAVRPAYAGGPQEVINIFAAARYQVSVSKIVDILSKLGHVYPYHQAIGFYLQRAGIPVSDLQPLRELGINFNFYIANRIEPKVLDLSWRLFVPQGLGA